jgi:GAF domain-containing protein
MAQELLAAESVHEVLHGVLGWSLRVVEGAEEAGISVAARGGQVRTVTATGELAATSDRLQNDLGEGPCLDALWREHPFCVPDLATETRWPRYAAEAAGAGIRSVLAFRLLADERTLGALNLFSTTPHAFDEVDREIGLIVASHAGVAFRWARTEEQLNAAIDSRQCIGEAIGMLVERFDLTPAAAFAYLARASQDTNTKLRHLAEQLVSTGVLPVRNGGRIPV